MTPLPTATHDTDVAAGAPARHRPLGSGVVAGLLTYPSNRAVSTPRARVAGPFRIALVGDSMTYAAGLPYQRSLAARLGVHLNGALPGLWTESVPFGVPGGCLNHATGRVLTQVLPVEPDVVVLCLCCNDATLMSPQPADPHELGQQWKTFRPLMDTTLEVFRDEVTRAGAHPAVLYLDQLRQAGEVSPPIELESACAARELPFLDGSALLAGYSSQQLNVSVADGHLSAFANDIVARALAQFLLGLGWAPVAAGFEDERWIDAIERCAHARVAAGVPRALAYGDALTVLQVKWMHRANTNRQTFKQRYEEVRERLAAEHGATLTNLGLEVVSRAIRVAYPLSSMTMAELWTNEAAAVLFAFEHVANAPDTDLLREDLGHLTPPRSARGVIDIEFLQRCREIAENAGAVLSLLTAHGGAHGRHDSAELQYLFFWRSRVMQWALAADCCAKKYLEVLPKLTHPSAPEVERLLSYLEVRLRPIRETLDAVRRVAEWIPAVEREAVKAIGATWLTLEFVVTAPPGSDVWAFNVGVDSISPGFAECHASCGNLIRDGRPHRYDCEIQLMLLGDLHLEIAGAGFSKEAAQLVVHNARLRWHGGVPSDVALARPEFTLPYPDAGSFTYRRVRTIALPG